MHKAPDGRPNQDCTAWGPIAPGPNASTAMGTLDQLNNDPPNNMTDYLPNMYELALLNISSHFDLAMTWVSPTKL